MKSTDVLKEEHEVIRKMLQILSNVCEKLEKKENVEIEDLKLIIEFIRNFADKCHHGKEEDRLFPMMEEFGVPKEGAPIGVMLQEHELGRSYVINMAASLEKKDFSKFVENVKNYIELLDPHIEKENTILYMIADMHIPEDKQKELLKEFEKFEKEVIGKGEHKKFHKIVENLKRKYL